MFARHLMQLKDATDKPQCRGVWIFGEPGVGKSHAARHNYGSNYYLKQQNKWWDDYQGQPVVILEDHDNPCLGHYLKIWADRFVFKGEAKGSSMNISPDLFIVTSNYTPDQLYGHD